MKDLLKKLSAVAVLVALFGFVACAETVDSSSSSSTGGTDSSSSSSADTLSGPYVKVYVQVLENGNATNLGSQVLYMVGDMAGLPIEDGSTNVATWDPASPIAELTDEGNGLWSITLSNTLTNNTSFSYKFVNGSSGFGGTWDNQEQQWTTNNGGEWEDRGNRALDVLATNILQEFYLTNTAISTNDDVNDDYNGIANWKGLGSTAQVTVTVNLTLEGVANAADPVVASGTNIILWGAWNSWGGAVTNAAVDANGDVTFVFDYTGAVSVGYQLRVDGFNGSFDESGNNDNLSASIAEDATGTIYLTNSDGAWRAW